MDPILTSSLSLIKTFFTNTNGGKTAVDELSSAFWQWVRPVFLKDDNEFITELENNKADDSLQIELENKLKRKIKNDPAFKSALENWLATNFKTSSTSVSGLKAKNDIEVKIDQEGSVNLNSINSENGSIKFEIKQ